MKFNEVEEWWRLHYQQGCQQQKQLSNYQGTSTCCGLLSNGYHNKACCFGYCPLQFKEVIQ